MTRNKKLLQKSQTFKKLFYFVRESSGIKNGIEHEQINWNCMSLACASTKQCNLNKMDAQNNEANWRKHLPENHDTNDLKIQFVALLNYEQPKERKAHQIQKNALSDCSSPNNKKSIHSEEWFVEINKWWGNHECHSYLCALCWTAHKISVLDQSSRANEEQIKQPLIIHSHTVICIKFQANTKLFEWSFELFSIVGDATVIQHMHNEQKIERERLNDRQRDTANQPWKCE